MEHAEPGMRKTGVSMKTCETEEQQVLTFVAHVIEDVVGIDLGDSADRDALVGPEGLGLESIGLLEVIVHLEREYDLGFPDETMETLLDGTLGAFVDEVLRLREAAAADAGSPV
jgi:acyl carrier protein